MADRVLISFKDTELEKELLEYLKQQGKLIGASSYIKQLLYEDMLKKKGSAKDSTEK